MGIFSALLRVLYILGRRDAKQIHERNELKQDLLNEKKSLNFIKQWSKMTKLSVLVSTIIGMTFLTRLRDKGI